MKLGIIGLGNMGKALVRGIISKEIFRKEDIYGFDIIKDRTLEIKDELQININEEPSQLCQDTQVIIIAVKPQDLKTLLSKIKGHIESHIIISICAGITIDYIANILGNDKKIARVMPNTPFLVGAGASAVAFNTHIDTNDKKLIISILESGSLVFEVDEELIDPITALSGSSPAFVFLFIEALADGGVKAGIPRDTALKLAAQSVFGAAKLMLETNTHPAILKDMVSSPAGTTIAGISTLEKGAFRGLVIEGVFSAYKRASKI